MEPIAARMEPDRVQAAHQSLHHVVAKAEWDDDAVLGAVRGQVLPAMERHGPIAYWIVDDTGFPKQGKHSVGVARQYCGQLGKQDSCQVAVNLSVANDHASLPVAYQLYLPEAWAEDAARRAKAGVPEEVTFEAKTAIALGQMRQALADGVPVGVVLGDAGYGQYCSLCDSDGGVEVDARGRLWGARAQRVAAHLALDPTRYLPAPGARHALLQDLGQDLVMLGKPVPKGEKPQAAAACGAPRARRAGTTNGPDPRRPAVPPRA